MNSNGLREDESDDNDDDFVFKEEEEEEGEEEKNESYFVLNPGVARRTESCSLEDSDEGVRTIYASIMYSGEESKEWNFHPLYPTKYDGVIYRLKVKIVDGEENNVEKDSKISSNCVRTFLDLKNVLNSFFSVPSDNVVEGIWSPYFPKTRLWICYKDNPFLPLKHCSSLERDDGFDIKLFETIVGQSIDRFHFMIETRFLRDTSPFPLEMLSTKYSVSPWGVHEAVRELIVTTVFFFDMVSNRMLDVVDWKSLKLKYRCEEFENPEFESERVQFIVDDVIIHGESRSCLSLNIASLDQEKRIFVPKFLLM